MRCSRAEYMMNVLSNFTIIWNCNIVTVKLYQWGRHTEVFIYERIWTFLLYVMSQLSKNYGQLNYKQVICDIVAFAEPPMNTFFFGAST